MKFKTDIKSVQTWIYSFETEAKTQEEADKLAVDKYLNGEDGDANYVDAYKDTVNGQTIYEGSLHGKQNEG